MCLKNSYRQWPMKMSESEIIFTTPGWMGFEWFDEVWNVENITLKLSNLFVGFYCSNGSRYGKVLSMIAEGSGTVAADQNLVDDVSN